MTELSLSIKLSGKLLAIKVSGEDFKEAVLKLTPFLEHVDHCDICGKDNCTSLRSRSVKDGEFLYMEFFCTLCHAKRQFGDYKKPKGALFLKKWEKWENKVKDPEGY